MRRFVLPFLIAPLLAGCGVNSVPTAEERANAAWADVESSYQRRVDLVPNLVATVQGVAEQEREVLTQVTEARSRAAQINLDSDDLRDPQAMERFAEAQNNLSGALQRLNFVVERYPELRSQENFAMLQSQLEGTENRIDITRRDYNEAVRAYNTEIRTFPSLLAARFIYGAERMEPYEAVTEGAEEAPTVEF